MVSRPVSPADRPSLRHTGKTYVATEGRIEAIEQQSLIFTLGRR